MPVNVVKSEHDEELWNKAKKAATKEGRNEDFKYIMGIYETMRGSAADSNRTTTPFGHLKVEECILTAESVDGYSGKELPSMPNVDPEKIYQIYRPASEITKAIDSYNQVPLVNEHHFVDKTHTNRDKWLGTTGSDAKFKDGKLINTVAVWSKDGVDLVERVKQGLSCGYSFSLVNEQGQWNGKHYDFKMSDIVCNHVALVGNPRVQVAKLADSFNNILINGETNMDAAGILKILIKNNPSLVADASKEYEKELETEKLEKELNDKKKGKDETHREKTSGGESTDDDPDDETEDDDDDEKDKEKSKDKKAKDKKAKDKDDDDKDEKLKEKSMTGDDISRIVEEQVQYQLKEHTQAHSLCERVLGKVSFGVDSRPEYMYDETLKAKNVKIGDMSITTKIALLKYIADNKAATVERKSVYRASDSQRATDKFECLDI